MGGVRDRRGEYGRGYGEERCIWEGLGRGEGNIGGARERRGGYGRS